MIRLILFVYIKDRNTRGKSLLYVKCVFQL